MNEKSTLLPSGQPFKTAPSDVRFDARQEAPPYIPWQPSTRIIIAPELEFVPSRKFRYGMHALASATLILFSFILVELRDCNFGQGIDLDKLQALHVGMLIFTFTFYLLSLFNFADFLFRFKCMYALAILIIYVFISLMIWMVYEAAVNPCVKTFQTIPIDATLPIGNKNVFTRTDVVGILVLMLDIFATILSISAAVSFQKRH